MGRIAKWWEWIKVGLAFIGAVIVGVVTFGAVRAREKVKEATKDANVEHEVVQRERERTEDETASQLYEDIKR